MEDFTFKGKKMEQRGNGEEEHKHVCRLCGKKYPSGKSLGGHMRSHVIASLNKTKSKQAPSFGNNGGRRLQSVKSKRVLTDSALADDGRYGLRENPKKTWRAVDTKVKASHERICKRCGKGFQSLKALCGHMSSHSIKGRNFSRLSHEVEDDDDFGNSRASEELLLESHSDNVVEFSSENSEIEIGQEEVALCLMMLSRDSSQRVGFNSSEYSDNSSAIDAANRKKLNFSSSISMNSNVNGSVGMDNSDSGYFEKGSKELESDDSVGGYSRNRGIKRPRAESDESEFASGKKNASNADNEKAKGHWCPFCSKVFRSGQALGGHKRSHSVGISARDKASLIRSVEDDSLRNHHHLSMPDLNLPAPTEEDGKW